MSSPYGSRGFGPRGGGDAGWVGGPAPGGGAGTQTIERPWTPRPAAAPWVPPPAAVPDRNLARQAEQERADRRDRVRRGVIGAGIALLAVLLLIALVVIAKSATDDTPDSGTNRGAGEAGAGAEPLGPDSNVDPGGASVLPGPLPPASPTPEVPAGDPLAPAPAPPAATPAVPPAQPPANAAVSGPVQPIDPSPRPPAVTPAQFPPPTLPPTATRRFEGSSFTVRDVHPGPMTFATSGCTEPRIYISKVGDEDQDGPLPSPPSYGVTSVGDYGVRVEARDSGSCSTTVTYQTRS